MKKVLVLWDDVYHPYTNIQAGLAKALPKDTWEVTTTTKPADLDVLPKDLDLLIFFSNPSPKLDQQGKSLGVWRDDTTQDAWQEKIAAGVGALFVHAGLTAYPSECIVHKQIAHGRFIKHPEHCITSFDPAPAQKQHPILKDVDAFTMDDEHYFCQVDTDLVLPLAYATSQHGTTIAAWAHEIGKGRVACACPGHFAEVYDHQSMITLVSNMARWATWQV